MLYVRKKAKGFGRNAQIEGHFAEGERILLVEDLTTDGRSKVNFCTALRQAGATVDHIFVLFFYDIYPEGRKILADLGIAMHALATWWDVLRGRQGDPTSSSRRCWPRSRHSCMTPPAGRRRMAGWLQPPPNELAVSPCNWDKNCP